MSKKRRGAGPALSVVNPHAAGVDVGAGCHYVAVPEDRDERPVRRFGCFTADLHAIADWLLACGVTTVAMESTGVYWVPLFEVLSDRGLDVRLVDPRRLKSVPGRKTDVQDCQWLRQLHAFGLLSGAFRPDEQTCRLRALVRQRSMLIRYASDHVRHMQKALEQMNLKLAEVVSDVTGVTGMGIIKAVLAGEWDAAKLAALRDRRCASDERTIRLALEGTWREEHLLELRQAVELFEKYQAMIGECDAAVAAVLERQPDRAGGAQPAPRPRKRKRERNEPPADARGLLMRMCGVDLTAIEGIEPHTALKILSEVGPDVSRFPTSKHFCSWLGLCPGNKRSGERSLSGRTRRCANRTAQALRMAAFALSRSKSALGAYLRRMRGKLGMPKAVTATAHKLARLVYAMLRHGTAYAEQTQEQYQQRYERNVIRGLEKRAAQLGYHLVPAATPQGEVP